MKKGQTVNFEFYDNLFSDVVYGTGILVHNLFGKLWTILPAFHERLSGEALLIHENFITEVDDLLLLDAAHDS